MKKICSFEIKSRPVAWRIEKKDGRSVLSKGTRDLIAKIREIVLKKFSIKLCNSSRELEMTINLYEKYDRNFINPEHQSIPDVDHVATLIMNALKLIFYKNDVQISSLAIHRWRVENHEKERILITLYQLERI